MRGRGSEAVQLSGHVFEEKPASPIRDVVLVFFIVVRDPLHRLYESLEGSRSA